MSIKINESHPDMYKYKQDAPQSWFSREICRECYRMFCLAFQSLLGQINRMPNALLANVYIWLIFFKAVR